MSPNKDGGKIKSAIFLSSIILVAIIQPGHAFGCNWTNSFDRILDISITEEPFSIPENFNASDYFWECFGIVKDTKVPLEHVVIRAFGKEQYYMRDLPFHHFQKEISEGEGYADFELYLRPTLDFMGHLLSRSSQIKVLEPRWLADKICRMYEESMQRYKE